MSFKQYWSRSLSRQFGLLMGSFFLFFVIGAAILLTTLHYLNESFMEEKSELETKDKLQAEISDDFNEAFFNARGYIAFGNKSMRDNAVALGPKIRGLTEEYQKIAATEADRQFLNDVKNFSNYYFDKTLPKIIKNYEAGNVNEVVTLASQKVTPEIGHFRQRMREKLQKQDEIMVKHFQKLIKIEMVIQVAFVLFILMILFILLRIMGYMFRLIGQPLSLLAGAANQIANGKEAVINLDTSRDDEIGVLSSSFQQMAEKILEKEQHLLARNKELANLFQRSEEERNRNQVILDTLQEGVQLVNLQGSILQINDYLCQMFQCENESLIGLSQQEWIMRIQKSVREEALSSFLAGSLENPSISSAEDESFVYTMVNPHRVIKVYSQGIFNSSEKIGTVFVHRDITKEFEVDKIKSEFVSTVSHELRTPLSSVLGFTELMLNRELNPQRRKTYLTTILHEAKRLTALINDFLDVQKMEAGKQVYEKEYIHLLPILNSVIENRKITTNKHEFVLETDIGNPVIFGDQTKIEQVFTNLISNAVKYSPGGGVIKVQIQEDEKHIHISVIDQGLGIPKDAINKLFEKFYRVDNTDRRRIGGTGLGLSIVHEIVKAHDGEINVQSEYGKGSTFTVVLPIPFMQAQQGNLRFKK